MLKTCAVCGGIHDINKVCYRNRQKKSTPASRFRNTYEWQSKRDAVKKRDKHLCQVCVRSKYKTSMMYNFSQTEVHHIIPIEEDFSKRLDSENLITLCNYHHKMAETGAIPREELQEMIREITSSPPPSKKRK